MCVGAVHSNEMSAMGGLRESMPMITRHILVALLAELPASGP